MVVNKGPARSFARVGGRPRQRRTIRAPVDRLKTFNFEMPAHFDVCATAIAPATLG
ncbi:hypothetical protein MMSP_1891 [Mycobacterium sp. 012931]|nr:hypothetical protein MMSP_1891 [Mycobacterium sp. 012931]